MKLRCAALLAAAVLLAGVFFAPTMIVAMALVERNVPERQLTEGLTWLLAGLNVGVAIGAPSRFGDSTADSAFFRSRRPAPRRPALQHR